MGGLSDADADDRIAEAAEMVRGYCGWHVWPSEDQTVTVDARGGDMVPLPTLKLTAVDTVEHRELYDHTSTWTAATSGWDFSEGGWLLASGCWPDGPRTVRVAMTSGWPDCPRGVAAVVVGLAGRLARMPGGISSEQSGGESVSYTTSGGSEDSGADGQLTRAEQRVLDLYRLDNRP